MLFEMVFELWLRILWICRGLNSMYLLNMNREGKFFRDFKGRQRVKTKMIIYDIHVQFSCPSPI